ncbi:F-box domain-containing protein [Caenorhabditis elegans]|uniref:F-box domain-containing protein n=1 Tax=Caenorhabditis elegans TaxID=6239 RepID=Q9XVB6_CAEEL|nr:F-box domain-containing protein [Caenorhabditis elegans]CAB03965.1 F-box domain-containing protein [Caenorhabditis elegans]|eukprot:NP_507761.1 Uncharacterized protein CELE_C43D7.8 [Caenorhabditis elegans]
MTTFPILRLPEKSLKIAIRCLTMEQIIKFSLISESTKRTAESLNLQADPFWICFGESVHISVHANFVENYQQDIPWNPVEVDLRTLLDHFQSVLHTNKFEYFFV